MRSKLINKPVRTPLRAALLAGATALVIVAGSGAAQASLIADGVTYTLTDSATANPLVDQFTLDISRINGTSDAEGGRSGVDAFAFTQPTNYSTATAPGGFTLVAGGLNSGGCQSNSANFYCFSADTTPSFSPALSDNSSLSYTFTVTLSSGNFSTYDPHLKITWVGSQSKIKKNGNLTSGYDLVSKALPISRGNGVGTSVPEPGSLALLGTGLIGLGLAMRRRRRS